jgi:hypothetical protein
MRGSNMMWVRRDSTVSVLAWNRGKSKHGLTEDVLLHASGGNLNRAMCAIRFRGNSKIWERRGN